MRILNISYALPSQEVSNEKLIKELIEKNRDNLSAEELVSIETQMRKLFKMSGTVTRYHRGIGERALDFGVKAGKAALKKAGVKPEDVDLLIYAGVARGWIEPATANLFQSELGLNSATCFDVMDACASWIRSLAIAKSFLAQKAYKLVMILNCEFTFREYANFDFKRQRRSGERFFGLYHRRGGDGHPFDRRGALTNDSLFSFKTWGDKHGLCKIPLPNADDFSPNNSSDGLKPMSFFHHAWRITFFHRQKAGEPFQGNSGHRQQSARYLHWPCRQCGLHLQKWSNCWVSIRAGFLKPTPGLEIP